MVLPALRGEAQHSECDPVKAHWQLNSTTPSAKEANPAPAPARIDESCLMGLQWVIESPRLSSTPPCKRVPALLRMQHDTCAFVFSAVVVP